MRFSWLCVVAFVMVSFCSCGKNDDLLPDQKENIVRYLDSKQLEYTIQDGVYKHVANKNRAGYAGATEIANGDVVQYKFEAYTFNTAPEMIFYTNKKFMVDSLAKGGLNTQFWPTDPLEITVGSSPMIEGLVKGIPYCREGDSVLLFIPPDLAFGDTDIGVVPSNTTLLYILNIENVKK